MAILDPNVDYTDFDFDSINARLDSIIDQVFPDWKSREDLASFGNILKEAVAFVLDVLGFYQDRHAAETFFATVRQRKSILAAIKLINYVATGATAASTDLTFTLGAVNNRDVTIPANTIVSTLEVSTPIRFRVLIPILIPAGTNPPVGIGTAVNSEEVEDDAVSTGLGGQKVTLSRTGILEASVSIQADDGLYTQVGNFLGSTSTDRHFTLAVDQSEGGVATFGNGINGTIPSGAIVTSYEVGGGAAGEVDPGSLTRIQGQIFDSAGVSVTVTVVNTQKAAGGAERQALASIKELAPESLRVLTRSVAQEDFEIAAVDKHASVARALLLTSDDSGAIAENTGNLYLVSTTGGATSTAVKTEVRDIFYTRFEDGGLPTMVTYNVIVFDAPFKVVDVLAVVFFNKGASPTTTKLDIVGALDSFFAVLDVEGKRNTTVDFGFKLKAADGTAVSEIALSDVFNVVNDRPGVRKIGDATTEFVLNSLHQDVSLSLEEFPALGMVTIIDGDTGLAVT